ncbi:MAG: VOC family protein [Candidatus Delongbacteria bacterium]|nr:VOC family protein [Candidatus Delongbacteria bacterium]
MKFCWTTLHVRDMKKSLKFYQKIVGLSIVRRMKPNPDMEIVFLGEGETQVELISDNKSGNTVSVENISLGFDCGSLDKIKENLEENNIPVHEGPFKPNPHIQFLYVLDPDGFKVQFVENIR